jgi:hypothetical protein
MTTIDFKPRATSGPALSHFLPPFDVTKLLYVAKTRVEMVRDSSWVQSNSCPYYLRFGAAADSFHVLRGYSGGTSVKVGCFKTAESTFTPQFKP